MAKTITLSDVSLASIVITTLTEDDNVTPAGFACRLDYNVINDAGEIAYHSTTQRYSEDTDYPDVEKLSAESAEIVLALRDSLQERMREREGLN